MISLFPIKQIFLRCFVNRIFLISSVFLLFTGISYAGDVTLAWDAVAQANLGGYKLFYGPSSNQMSATADAGNNTSMKIQGLQGGSTYFFAVKAYSADRTIESEYSNVVSTTVTVPVAANFTENQTSGYAPLLVNFADSSTGDITDWNWDFGDGTTSTAPFAMKTYGSAGTYTVSLAVSGPNGTDIKTKTNLITVEEPPLPPTANFAANVVSGTAPMTIDFSDLSSGDISNWLWDFGDGTTSTSQNPSHTFNSAGIYTVSLTVNGSGGNSTETKAGYIDLIAPGSTGSGDGNPSDFFEVGSLTVSDQWTYVAFSRPFTDPVVVTGSLSYDGTDPAVVRIQNISSTGFEVRIQEWDYLDGTHTVETLNYLVMERGRHTLEDGTQVEAGSIFTNRTGRYADVRFAEYFTVNPIVLTDLNSTNGSQAVTTRVRNISTDGFQVMMQEQQANRQSHTAESISYIAWEPAMATLGTRNYEVNRTGDEVKHRPYRLFYQQSFMSPPIILVGMQTADGGDPANLRWSANDEFGVDVMVTEEQSKDAEVSHTTEVVGYILFAQ